MRSNDLLHVSCAFIAYFYVVVAEQFIVLWEVFSLKFEKFCSYVC